MALRDTRPVRAFQRTPGLPPEQPARRQRGRRGSRDRRRFVDPGYYLPALPSEPSRIAPRPPRSPSRFPRRLPLPVPALGLLGGLALLDHFIQPNRFLLEVPGMVRCDGPHHQKPSNWSGWMNHTYNAVDCPPGQLGGQALGSNWWSISPQVDQGTYPTLAPGQPLTIPGNTPQSMIVYYGYQTGTGAWRGLEHTSFTRVINTSPLTIRPRYLATVGIGNPLPDPNIKRWMDPEPQPATRFSYGHGTALSEFADAGTIIDLSPVPSRQIITRTITGLAPGEKPSEQPVPTPMPQPPPGNPYKPPRANVRERKSKTRAARMGQAIFGLLDTVSETADIVDMMFAALPCSVQKRWERKYSRENIKLHRGRTGSTMVDQFGQYGFNGADWKLHALWHNWHLLDPSEAWQNIAWNLLEDQAYGQIHKRIPTQAGGQAMDGAFMEFNKLLGELPLPQPKKCK